MSGDNDSPWTAQQIVDGLRGEDPECRQKALDQLFLGSKNGAVLLQARALTVQATTTSRLDAGRLFNGLVYLAQQFGKAIGLQLAWVPEPQSLEIAPGNLLR